MKHDKLIHTLQTALLERGVGAMVTSVRFVFSMSSHVYPQFRFISIRDPALVAYIRPNAQMDLVHVFV